MERQQAVQAYGQTVGDSRDEQGQQGDDGQQAGLGEGDGQSEGEEGEGEEEEQQLQAGWGVDAAARLPQLDDARLQALLDSEGEGEGVGGDEDEGEDEGDVECDGEGGLAPEGSMDLVVPESEEEADL
jgi:hypothetical protein